jgi:hypothetical protein
VKRRLGGGHEGDARPRSSTLSELPFSLMLRAQPPPTEPPQRCAPCERASEQSPLSAHPARAFRSGAVERFLRRAAFCDEAGDGRPGSHEDLRGKAAVVGGDVGRGRAQPRAHVSWRLNLSCAAPFRQEAGRPRRTHRRHRRTDYRSAPPLRLIKSKYLKWRQRFAHAPVLPTSQRASVLPGPAQVRACGRCALRRRRSHPDMELHWPQQQLLRYLADFPRPVYSATSNSGRRDET